MALWLIGQSAHSGVTISESRRQAQRVKYLERIVDIPFEKSDEVRALRFENPEWQLFTYSFATFAMANIALRDPSRTPELATHMRKAIDNCFSPVLASGFRSSGLQPATSPHRLAIYYGHLNLMIGLYREVSGDTTLDLKHEEITRALFGAVMASPTRNIESYPGMIWPADNSVVMASLAVFDRIHDTDYGRAADEWVDWINERFLDENGLMHSQINPLTHLSIDGPRGCSVAWTSMFARYFAPRFADEQYRAMKKHLGGRFAGIFMFRERPDDHSTGIGDIDSGPLFFGFGVAATGLGYGAANAAGDTAAAREIRGLIECFGRDTLRDGERRYRLFGPLSDALVLWGETGRMVD